MRTIEEIREEAVDCYNSGDYNRIGELAEELASLDDPAAEGYALTTKCIVQIRNGEMDEAQDSADRAYTVFERIGEDEGRALALIHAANIARESSNLEKAFELYNRSLEVYKSIGHSPGIANASSGIANIYSFRGEFPSAYEYYRRSLDQLDEKEESASVAALHLNFGTLYLFISELDKALEQYTRARYLMDMLGNEVGAAEASANIAGVLYEQGKNQEAIETISKSLPVFMKAGKGTSLARAYANMISGYAALGDIESAQKMAQLYDEMSSKGSTDRATYFLGIADIAQAQGDYETVKQFCSKSLSMAEEAGIRQFEAEAHMRLRDACRELNDFDGYVKHNDKYISITEEIKGKDAMQQLGVLEAEKRIEGELRERDKERALLYGALPKLVADRILAGEDVSGDRYANATVIFLDVVGFTTHSSKMEPHETGSLLAKIFEHFDRICEQHNVTKIKTIGDSYMAVAFDSAAAGAEATIAMMKSSFNWPDGSPLQFRAGIHSGPVVAGVIGTQRMQYDVWGDTVNVASRMESSGEAGRIQVSEAFASAAGDAAFSINERGSIEIKGKGMMKTFWLEGA